MNSVTYKLWRGIPTSALLVAVAAAGFAQPQGPGAFSEFREKHKYTFQLMSMVRHMGEIDKDPKYALTPEQAKKVLAVLQPLRSKPKLTQDAAKEALKELKRVFTVNQLNAMAKIKPRLRPGQLGGGGRPSGQPGGPIAGDRSNRPRFDPSAMQDFNPFYAKAPAGDKYAAERIKRWNEIFAKLQKKASAAKPQTAGKPAKK